MRADREAKLLAIAAKQYSVFTRGQVLAVGLSDEAIRSCVESGRWRRLHRGVYLPASVPVDWEQQVFGAQLACGDAAAASCHAAALVWEFMEELDERPHVSVPYRTSRRHKGIVVHRVLKVEATTHKRFRVTTPMRTLLDVAGYMPELRVERMLDDAHRRGRISVERMRRYLDEPANRSLPGSGLLREMLAVRDPSRPIDSDLETLFFSALRRFGLPLPVPQHPVKTRSGPKFIDFAYVDHHLAIELDGFGKYGTRGALDADRARQNELEELGFHFRRFTWTQLAQDAPGVAITVGSALGLVPRRWGPRDAPSRRAHPGGAASAALPPRTSRRG